MTSVIIPPVDLAPGMPSRVVTISATDVTEGGQSQAGQKVVFALSDTLDVTSGGDVIAKTQATVTLDGSGEGSIRLPVYDEDVRTWKGREWAILVSGLGSQKAIRVPAGTSSIALSALPPVRPLRGREKQWAVTGASVSVTEGAQWDIDVSLSGGVLDFDFTVPPGAVAWFRGPVDGTTTSMDQITEPGIFGVPAYVQPTNRPPGASAAGWVEILPFSGLSLNQIWTDGAGGWTAIRFRATDGSYGPWTRSIDHDVKADDVSGLFDVPGIVYDAFDRTDGSLRTPTSGGDAWSATTDGTAGLIVSGGMAKASAGTGNTYGWVPTGGDVTVTARVGALGSSPIAGVVARYASPTDQLVAQLRASSTDTTYTLFQRAPGLTALVTSTVAPKVGDVFGVRVSGTTAQLVVNGEVLGSAGHSRTGADSGVYFNGDDQVTALDDFTVTGA